MEGLEEMVKALREIQDNLTIPEELTNFITAAVNQAYPTETLGPEESASLIAGIIIGIELASKFGVSIM